MNKTIRWLLFHVIVLTLILLGVVGQASWAANVFKFWIWFILFVNFIGAFTSNGKDEVKAAVPTSVNFFVQLGIAFTLASQAWFGYATLTMVNWAFYTMPYFRKMKDKQEETKTNG